MTLDNQYRELIRAAVELSELMAREMESLEERVRILERQVTCFHPSIHQTFDNSGPAPLGRCALGGHVRSTRSGFSLGHGD
jgi:hypothetical protein